MIETTQNDKQSEAESIGKSFAKIAKLSYGKNGLLTFLNDLFFNLDVEAKK